MDGRRALLLALALMMAIPAVALADVTGTPNVGWGLTPDHPLWKAELFVEWARTATRRDPLERAKYEMDIRERRLADAQAMLALGRNDSAAVALANYQEHGASIEQEIASERARPEFTAVKARLEQHKLQTAQREAAIVGGIPAEARNRLMESDKSIDRASDQAQAKADMAQKSVKDWLRLQEKTLGMDSGISLVAVYEGMTKAGKVPPGQLDNALRWYNSHYKLPQSLNGQFYTIIVTKGGIQTDAVTISIENGAIRIMPGTTNNKFTVQSENIPAYVGHMMANDRLSMAGDLREMGVGKDLISLAGLI